jgi:phage baseplate assembly protein W
MAMYRGFSTLQGNFSSTKVVDSELVKRDLLNAFAIRKGEKVGVPGYGSGVLDLVMEPLTEEVKNLLLEEVTSTRIPVLLYNNLLLKNMKTDYKHK